MTHTLHPEIVDDIVNSMNHYVDKHMYHALGMKKVLEKHLGPYLHMPQPIENEPLPEDKKRKTRLEQIVELCKDTRYSNDYIGGFVRRLMPSDSKKEEQKQSTPQIEKIEPMRDSDVLGGEPTPAKVLANKLFFKDGVNTAKINEIIDYINNTLPTNNE